jgi:hypothetical protein
MHTEMTTKISREDLQLFKAVAAYAKPVETEPSYGSFAWISIAELADDSNGLSLRFERHENFYGRYAKCFSLVINQDGRYVAPHRKTNI